MRPYHERFRDELRRGRTKKRLRSGEKELRQILLESDRRFWKMLYGTFKYQSDIKLIKKMERKYALVRPNR